MTFFPISSKYGYFSQMERPRPLFSGPKKKPGFTFVTDVPTWLKSLRLHKYAYLFQQMTYEEMLSVSEEWLETQVGVSSWG